MTGLPWLEETGLLSSPVAITNTHQVGVVRDALVEYAANRGGGWFLPVVAETYDGFLNDINAFHVTKDHVFLALDSASGGPVAEGCVGGGTGMMCHGFKGGIGTSSRVVEVAGEGSIIVIVATDAPLLPIQCRRLAQRATVGLARAGGVGHNGSGDIFLAFSTGNHPTLDSSDDASDTGQPVSVQMIPNHHIDPLFEATAEAVEESILNALTSAETTTGFQGRTAHAILLDQLQGVMEKYRPQNAG